MYYSAYAAQVMKLVAVILHVLLFTIAPLRRMLNVSPSHLTSVGSRILSYLYRLGVNAEHRLATVYSLGYGLTDILTGHHGLLATLVVLTTGNQVGCGSTPHSVFPLLKR